ncbi:MAG: hypothetical protein ACO1RX_19660 [Candidatus Sericytochromatia bacterium]
MSPKLDPAYFEPPRAWWFNSRDFFIYYYVLGAVMVGLFILSLLLFALPQGERTPSVPQTQTSLPSVAVSLEPAANNVSSPNTEQSLEERIASAESQPVLPLKIEAYAQILSDPSLSSTDKARVDKVYQAYRSDFQRSEKQLQQVEAYLEKDYYSAGIRVLKGLLAQGESLGQLHTQALELQEKVYLRRIDYYLLKNQLTQAESALKEARETQIDPGVLDEYAAKILQLKAVGP